MSSDLHDLPLQAFLHHRTLDQPVALPLEPRARRTASAAQRAVVPPVGEAGPLVSSVGARADRAVAVDAVDLDGARVSP